MAPGVERYILAVGQLIDVEEHHAVVGHTGLVEVHRKVAVDYIVLVVVAVVRRMAVVAGDVDIHLAVEDTRFEAKLHTGAAVVDEDSLLAVGMDSVKVGREELAVGDSLVDHNPAEAAVLAVDNLEVDIALEEEALRRVAGTHLAEGTTFLELNL